MRLLLLATVYLAFIIQVNVFPAVHAYEPLIQLKFTPVTIDNGLSNNRTTGATKDSRGFMWFATDNGLSRYDGLSVKSFNADLGQDDVEFDRQFTAIYTNQSGHLYAGSKRLFRFNYTTEKLEMVFDEAFKDQPRRIRAIVEDTNHTIWIGARNGFFSLDTNKHLIHLPADTNGLHYEVWDLLKKENKIWLATRSHGVVVYNLADSTYEQVPLFNENKKAVNVILSLFIDKGIVWVGTKNNGIFKISCDNHEVISHEFPDKNVKRIRDITKDKKGTIWLGTMEGLYLYNPATKEYVRYAYKYHPVSSITHNSVFKVFIDEHQIMWLCTYAGGINFTDLQQKPINLVEARDNDPHFINNSIVSGFCVDKNNNVYIGTDHGGLNFWNRTTNRFSFYTHKPGMVSGTNVKCLVSDNLGKIWIGTYEGGISCFNPLTKKFTYFQATDGDPNALQSNIVYSLAFDKDNNLWIGTNKGVDYLNTKTNVISHKYTSNNIHMVYTDEIGDIWMGIDGLNLFSYNQKEGTFKKYLPDLKISSAAVLLRDSGNHLWIGGKNGLSVIDLSNNQLYHYDKKSGLSSNIIFGILEDGEDNIWVSSAWGLMKLQGAAASPDSFSIKVYSVNDGLQSNQFWRNSAYKSPHGEMFFGGVNGFNNFYPNRIGENTHAPKMAITDFKILNKTVIINQKINGQVVLTKSINELDELVLNHKQKVFTIDFVALHYSNSTSNVYKYMLYPFEEEWNYTSYPRTSATYTSLPAGNYQFKLQSANGDGIWSEDTLELAIKIVPPVWRTWWFIVLLSIVIGTFIFIVLNRRVNRIEQQKVKLEKLVELRTRDIEKQNEKLTDLNNLKDKLFSVIAHDLINPFQSIMGFSSLLERNYEKYNDTRKLNYIRLISDSSNKFYNLLENLLAWSRTQAGSVSFKPIECDISSMVSKLLSLLEHKFQLKDITVKNRITQPIFVMVDEQMILSVFNNLITNALKFTNEKGTIEIDGKKQGQELIVSIRDNGMGMEPQVVENLFNVGKVESQEGTSGEKGTGLGLQICKDFIERNGGIIWAQSAPKKGTTFYFSLPLVKDEPA